MNIDITIGSIDPFTNLSEEEIMSNWRLVKPVKPITEDMVWNIIVACSSLEIVFRRGPVKEMEQ